MRLYQMAPATSLEPGEYAVAIGNGNVFLTLGLTPKECSVIEQSNDIEE